MTELRRPGCRARPAAAARAARRGPRPAGQRRAGRRRHGAARGGRRRRRRRQRQDRDDGGPGRLAGRHGPGRARAGARPDVHHQGGRRAGRRGCGLGLRRLRGRAGLLPDGPADARTGRSEPTVSRPTTPTPPGWCATTRCAWVVSRAPGWSPRPRAGSSPLARSAPTTGRWTRSTWAESTVIQAVLALAGDLAEHLVEPARRARGRRAAAGAGRAAPSCRRRRARRSACRRPASSCCPWSSATPRSSASASCSTSATSWRWPPSSPATAREVREVERAAARVVLLDEYQDTGAAQEVLLTALFGDGHPVTAVGDPCQSIYGWRGASAGTLRRFPRRSAPRGPRPRTLSTTYRSGGRLLRAGQPRLRRAARRGRAGPAAAAGARAGGRREVRCALLPDVDAEAALGRRRRWSPGSGAARRSRRAAWSRAAVLCRKRSMFPRLRAAFDARGVPVEVVGLGGLLAVPEVADLRRDAAGARRPHRRRRAAAPAHRRPLAARPARPGGAGPPGPRARARRRRAARRPGRGGRARASTTRRSARSSTRSTTCPRRRARPAVGGGRRRLEALRDELRALRRRVDQPLPDLVADVERTLGLDVEVSARPGATDPRPPGPTSTPSPTPRRSSPATWRRTAPARPSCRRSSPT